MNDEKINLPLTKAWKAWISVHNINPKLSFEVLGELRFTIVFNNAIRELGWKR